MTDCPADQTKPEVQPLWPNHHLTVKSIINNLATRHSSTLSSHAFEHAYRNEHPLPDSLTADNVRQAYTQYKTAARKIKRVSKSNPGTTGPTRTPR